jgi:hypothetical protein
MLTLAYIRENAEWQNDVWLSFSDLIGRKQPTFVFLEAGDLVLTLEPGRRIFGVEEWFLGGVFRVSKFEETGDAFNYTLDLECTLSQPEGTPRYTVSRAELLRAHNWFPDPEGFFKPFPRAVWIWLRDTKGVPLPAVPVGEGGG